MAEELKNDNELENLVEDEETESDELFADEENPDFFWIFKRVGGGLIKSVFVLIVIGGILYFVFGNNFSPFQKIKSIFTTETKGEEEGSNEKKEEKIDEKGDMNKSDQNQLQNSQTVTSQSNNFTQNHLESITNEHYKLDQNQNQKQNGRIEQGILWLKNTQNLGNFSLESLSNDPLEIRARRINEYLSEVEKTLAASDQIVRPMMEEIRILDDKSARLTSQVKTIDDKLFFEIQTYNERNINGLMRQKIQLQQTLVEAVENRRVRRLLVKNMQQYATLLQRKQVPLYKLLRVR